MKAVIILCTLALAAVAYARPGETYTDKYDGINIEELVENDKLFDAYCKCLLDEGKCTADGNELKTHMADALQTDCSKCTPAQKAGAKTVIKKLINHKKDTWNKLKAKYDPSGKYSAAHEAELTELKQ